MKIQSVLVFLLLSKTVFAQTILSGKVTDKATKEGLIGASVRITKGDEVVKGVIADFDGEYRVPLDPGIYSVGFSYTGYKSVVIDSIQVLKGQISQLDVAMEIDSTYNPSAPTNYYTVKVCLLTPKEHKSLDKSARKLHQNCTPPLTSDSTQTQHKPKKKARRSSRSKH